MVKQEINEGGTARTTQDLISTEEVTAGSKSVAVHVFLGSSEARRWGGCSLNGVGGRDGGSREQSKTPWCKMFLIGDSLPCLVSNHSLLCLVNNCSVL